jgi:GDP-mannose 6-dehydrogenase
MNISVFGLGYVGAVSAACLSDGGHTVIGVDPQVAKVDAINAGRSPVVERDLDRLTEAGRAAGRLSATTDAAAAVRASDLALVCVGTPSQANGDLDMTFLERVCNDIGTALRGDDRYFVVVIRSTLLPGTTRSLIIPVLERASGRQVGRDLGVCVNPEFLREGSAVADFFDPPKVIIGASDDRACDLARQVAEQEPAPVVETDIEIAETTKYVDNAWHALKVAFANEVGTFAKHHDVDAHRVMDIFCLDDKLNLSAKYLKPGPAFGGSCLPKDVRALNYRARRLDLDLPLLGAILPSNQQHLERVYDLIAAQDSRKVGILGLSFKAGTDDLRESPTVHIVERLIGKGYDVRIYDANVRLAKLAGANRDYLLTHLPHISDLIMDTIDQVVAHADTIVIGNDSEEFRQVVTARADAGVAIVDLVRIAEDRESGGFYHGICW